MYRLLRTFLLLRHVPLTGDATPDPPENWAALLPDLHTHRLRPLAYWVARELGVHPSDPIHAELESAYYAAALRYDHLNLSLAEIGGAFLSAGLPLIALKGSALASRLYPHPACRPMEDLDLLVRPHDLEAASHTLASLGYSDKSFGIEDFRNPETGIVVDLHTELLNTTRIPSRRAAWRPALDAWWDRARLLPSLPGVWAFDPQDHFVYLCHHAWLHHGLQRPLAFLDICLSLPEVAASQQRGVWLQREEWGSAARGLWYALLSCQRRLGVVVPAGYGPVNAGPFEHIVHASATRGWLPELARYGYLWLAIPPKERMKFLRQLWSADRSVFTPGTCPRHTGKPPNRKQMLDLATTVLYHSPPERAKRGAREAAG
jgi:hypothetical protein